MFGNMHMHPVVTIKQNMNQEKGKLGNFLGCTFPLSTHPTPSVAYITADRQTFDIKQCLSMRLCVWVPICVCVCRVSVCALLIYNIENRNPSTLSVSLSACTVTLVWYLWKSSLSPRRHDRCWTLPPTTKASVILSSLISNLPQPLCCPLIHCPAYTAVCCSSPSCFLGSTRATAVEQLPTITQHSLALMLSLSPLHTHTHPKHPVLKIKGLPNSTLSLICWPVAHQSSSYSLPLASC